MALVIIGVGVLAFVEAQKSFVQNNSWSSHTATATLLANELRERMRRLPRHDPVTGLYLETQGTGSVVRGWGLEAGEITVDDFDDVDDYEDLRFGADGDLPGPIDAFGDVIAELDADGNPVGPVETRPNGAVLKAVADETRGEYLPPARTVPRLGEVFRTRVEPHPSREVTDDTIPQRKERYPWFLAPALVLFAGRWFGGR